MEGILFNEFEYYIQHIIDIAFFINTYFYIFFFLDT